MIKNIYQFQVLEPVNSHSLYDNVQVFRAILKLYFLKVSEQTVLTKRRRVGIQQNTVLLCPKLGTVKSKW